MCDNISATVVPRETVEAARKEARKKEIIEAQNAIKLAVIIATQEASKSFSKFITMRISAEMYNIAERYDRTWLHRFLRAYGYIFVSAIVDPKNMHIISVTFF